MQELQSFITYNKTGSFTLAAQSMNITQSAFSAQIKKLDRLVGVKLISRSTRGSRLTPEGELFLSLIHIYLCYNAIIFATTTIFTHSVTSY